MFFMVFHGFSWVFNLKRTIFERVKAPQRCEVHSTGSGSRAGPSFDARAWGGVVGGRCSTGS